MDAEVKARWVEALESGKYQQGQHALRTTDNRFCCLGVLCDLLDPDGWDGTAAVAIGGGEWVDAQTHGGVAGLPHGGILSRAGLPIHEAKGYAEMNDNGQAFAEIAQAIREEM